MLPFPWFGLVLGQKRFLEVKEMSKHAQLHSEKSPARIPLPSATQPPSTTSTVNKTSSTGISADASSRNAPKPNGNGHLPPAPEKILVSNSAFSANSAGRSLKNCGFNANEERALKNSDVEGCCGLETICRRQISSN
jgi:hypothetical protein